MRIFWRGAGAAVVMAFVAGCGGRTASKVAVLAVADYSSPATTLQSYFRSLREVDVEGVIACLAQPEPADGCAAVDMMVEACPFIVLAQGGYAEEIPPETKAYFDEIVANILPPFPAVITHDNFDGSAVFRDPKGAREVVVVFRKIGAAWKIDAAATFGSHDGAGAVEPDCERGLLRLRELRELKKRIDAGAFKSIQDAIEAVKALGFDVA